MVMPGWVWEFEVLEIVAVREFDCLFEVNERPSFVGSLYAYCCHGYSVALPFLRAMIGLMPLVEHNHKLVAGYSSLEVALPLDRHIAENQTADIPVLELAFGVADR